VKPLRRFLTFAPLVVVALAWSIRPAPLPASALATAPTSLESAPGSVPAPSAVLDSSATLSWGVLAGLDYRRGGMSPALAQLRGARVRIPGFVVPLDDFQDEAKEFLLVPYFGACVHTPPPPPNQMVFVRMSGGSKKLTLFAPVWIEGRLRVANFDSPYGVVGFQMTAERITPYSTDR